MQTLVLEAVAKQYGETAVVSEINLDVRAGEFLTLLGPSGCGKTTTLRMIAGFVTPTRGRILMDGADISRLPPNRREVGMVFQNYALFPHLNVYENISFGMKQRGATESARRTRVAELLELVQLQGYEKRLPAELSGGQLQRVAIARALVHRPRLVLADEPTGNLDPDTAQRVMDVLLQQVRSEGSSLVLVTHSQSAAALADRRLRLSAHGCTPLE
jgi:ABC-type Fe3+/spermidine/putrescine transport system ATPase subunit